MDFSPIANEPSGQPTSSDEPLNNTSVLEHAQSLWHELCALSQDRFLLAALETQRAGESLVDMLVAGVMFAVLMITAWLGLMAATVLMLIEHGMLASGAILFAVVGPESRSFLLKIFSGILLEKICKNLTRRFILLRKPRFVLRPPAPTRQGDRRIAPTMT